MSITEEIYKRKALERKVDRLQQKIKKLEKELAEVKAQTSETTTESEIAQMWDLLEE